MFQRSLILSQPKAAGPFLEQVASPDEEEEQSRRAAVVAALEQLEALAVDTAAGELTGSLLPALEHTRVAVLVTPANSALDTANEGLDRVWSCLVDLFCSADPRAAQVSLHRVGVLVS